REQSPVRRGAAEGRGSLRSARLPEGRPRPRARQPRIRPGAVASLDARLRALAKDPGLCEVEGEAPTTKHQAPEKHQLPTSNAYRSCLDAEGSFGAWRLGV